jgi:Zn-dependent protease with chaperone function
VVAHEVGHVKGKHGWLLLSFIIFSMIVIPSSLMVNTFSAIIVGLGFMLILYKAIRYAEHKADLFSAKIVGNEQMVLALTKITEYN